MYSSTITVMLDAARTAARGLLRDFGNIPGLQITRKGHGDFVSEADQRAENKIREILQRARPDYGFLMEESGKIEGTETRYRWIVDPLDGTSNFLHNLPFFCVAIALEQTLSNGKKEIVAAVVEAPMQQETFWAEKGKGAWLESNHPSFASHPGGRQRLRVSGHTRLEESLLDVASFNFNHTYTSHIVQAYIGHIGTIRGLGSSALSLAYIAAGRIDAYVQMREKPWDIAGGILLIREAGGMVSDIYGKEVDLELGEIVASNEKLHKELLQRLCSSEALLHAKR